ncbi:hypothetical protein [uncultured Erythrobacter sp.]|uniref:hypothetical protein n=1 Tax=uncultured Erythrobacter sp. TaxID=263913 RepID=UPI002622B1DB|nr:hypothetical protein [uncultured Erythrobacter sp.]
MEIWTERETIADPTPEQIHNTIADLRFDEPAVLSRAEEIYIQTMLTQHGFLLEKREGDAAHHYEAVPNDGRARMITKPPWWAFWAKTTSIYYFSSEEVIEAFQEYQKGNADPSFVTWNQIWI